MSTTIPVPCLWDANNNYLNNNLVSVSRDAQAIGIVNKPPAPFVPGNAQQWNWIPTLSVKDPNLGTIYLSITIAQWEALSKLTPSTDTQLVYVVGTSPQFPAGAKLDDSRLVLGVITAITVDGISYAVNEVTYNGFSPIGGIIDGIVYFPTPLVSGQTVTVNYYTI